ncbi:helix-turn-helix domain-containing protein [Intestinibacter bartlettii]|uniref:Helix-turn-helix domain-containing protein n=1 Tax=Intestinibacter bartlettii TaxID=261299 RepID=A0ABS6E0I7_9FIRM|nr:helix-turn-helix domain-containing protein [Intestinibacter bartlettii]MBU5337505.1 helix-turn-helix domain-containing protein [Intestinibacter bartlettii]
MESYTSIDNDFYSDRNLDPYEKTVLSYLIRYYNSNFGYSFPTREQIQQDNNISPSKLTKTLKSLQEKGYITIKNNHKKAGRNNIYYINKYLVVQQDSSQASEKPKPSNKSNNKKKQATEPQGDLNYKLGFIETSVQFTREFRDTELAELKEVDMKTIEGVCAKIDTSEAISPFVFLLDLQKYKRGIN